MPAEYVGKAVHKAAQEFGVDDDDTVYSGVVVSYSADALKWTVQYDHGAPLSTEEYTQQQVTTHHRGILCDEDSGDEVHRDMLRRYLRCSASGTGAWYLQGGEATPPAIARWHAHARTNARKTASRVRMEEWDRKDGSTARRAQACPRPPCTCTGTARGTQLPEPT
jgi:hypothetical protein